MSNAELFDRSYRSIWLALHRRDDPDLSQHERDILSHVPEAGCNLGELVRHLGLPKSTCSEIVKSLGQRGFLLRVRDRADERRVHISLTTKGRERVRDDRVLDQASLAQALAQLRSRDLATLLRLMRNLSEVARSLRAASEAARPDELAPHYADDDPGARGRRRHHAGSGGTPSGPRGRSLASVSRAGG